MSTRRSPSMGKTVPTPKGKNDDYELLQRITKDPHYVARLKGVDAPPPPTSANTAMGAPFTRNGNVGSGGAWAAAPATTRASSNALGLGGGGSSAGMARLWDNHYSQDRIPNYDAVNDRFCKFNLKKRAGSTERKNNTGVVDNNRIPVYSRNGVTSASADIGRGVGAPASGGRLAPLSGRASPVPLTQQQNFEGANNEANMGNAYMNTAAISSSGDSIDTLFQKSRHRLLALWEELGTLEADRAPLGPAMTLLPGQAPSVENIRTITNEIQRLVDLRNAAVEVEKAIELREGFLYLLQELAERFAAMASSTPTERDKAYRELVALVTPFRNASLQTVEAIGRWRDVYVHNSHATNTIATNTNGQSEAGSARAPTTNSTTVAPPYMWKGVSYLHKMNGDTYFLIHSRLGNLLEYEVRANPLLDPRKVKLSVDGTSNALPPVRVKNAVNGGTAGGLSGNNAAAVPFARITKAEQVLAEEASRQSLLREIHHDGRVLTAGEEAEILRRRAKGDDSRDVGLLRDETQWAARFTENANANNANGNAAVPNRREVVNSAFSKLSPIEIQNTAATNIQRIFKGHLARRYVDAKREQVVAATKIQRFVRKVLARREVNLRRQQVVAARKIQALQRGVSTRNRIAKVRNAHSAATMIQKVFRGYLTRKYTDMVRYLHVCATKIQATWRSYYVRQSVRNEISFVRNEAATKIQAVWRGYHVRGIARYNPAKIAKVIKLQAWFRGTIDRARVKELIIRRYAALRIQSIYRMVLAKRRCRAMRQEREDKSWETYWAVANTAATRIQSGWRMLVAKKAVAAKREAKRIQDLHLVENEAMEEKLHSQEELVRRHKAATKVQALARGHIARQQVAMLRYLIECAIKIQKIVRGRLGRIRAQSQRAILVSYMEEKSAVPGDKEKIIPSTSFVAEVLSVLKAEENDKKNTPKEAEAVSPKNELEGQAEEHHSVASSHDISAIEVPATTVPLSIDQSAIDASNNSHRAQTTQQEAKGSGPVEPPFLLVTLSISTSAFSEQHFRNTIARRANLPSATENIQILNIYKGSTNVCLRITGLEGGAPANEAAMSALLRDYATKPAVFRDLFAITSIRKGAAEDLGMERAMDIPLESQSQSPYSPTTRSPLKKMPGIVSPITPSIQIVTPHSQPDNTKEESPKKEAGNSPDKSRKRRVSLAVAPSDGEDNEVVPTKIGDADIPTATSQSDKDGASGKVPALTAIVLPKIELLAPSQSSNIRSALKSPRGGATSGMEEHRDSVEAIATSDIASPHVHLSKEVIENEDDLDAGDTQEATEKEDDKEETDDAPVPAGPSSRRGSNISGSSRKRHHSPPADDASEVRRPPSPMLRSHNHMPVLTASEPNSPTDSHPPRIVAAKVYSSEEEAVRYAAANKIQSFIAQSAKKQMARRICATKKREVSNISARQAYLSRTQEANAASSIIAINLVRNAPATLKAESKPFKLAKESLAIRSAKLATQQERNVASSLISRALRVAVILRSLREEKRKRESLDEAIASKQEAELEKQLAREASEEAEKAERVKRQQEEEGAATKASIAAALAQHQSRPDSALAEISELKRLASAERRAEETYDSFPAAPSHDAPVIDGTRSDIDASRPSSALAEIEELKRLRSAERRAEEAETVIMAARPDSAAVEIEELRRLQSAERRAEREPAETPVDFPVRAAGSTSPVSITSTAPRQSIVEATPSPDGDRVSPVKNAVQTPEADVEMSESARPSSALGEVEQSKEKENLAVAPISSFSAIEIPNKVQTDSTNEQSMDTRNASEGLVTEVLQDAIVETEQNEGPQSQPHVEEAAEKSVEDVKVEESTAMVPSSSGSQEVIHSVVETILESVIANDGRTTNRSAVVDAPQAPKEASFAPKMPETQPMPTSSHTVTASRPTSAIRALRQARSSRPSSAGEGNDAATEEHRLPLEDLIKSRPSSATPSGSVSVLPSSRHASARASRAVAAAVGSKRIPSLPVACDMVQAMLRYQHSALIAAYWREKQVLSAVEARRVAASTTIQCAARSAKARAVAAARRNERVIDLNAQLKQAEESEMERALAKLRSMEDDEWRLQILPSYNAAALAIFEREQAVKQESAKFHRAALKIQCLWRCYNARFMVRWMREDRNNKRQAKASAEAFVRESEAALKIQCAVRRHQAQQKSKRIKATRDEERRAKAALEARLYYAALRIQCCVRCYNARYTARFLREKKAAAEALAIRRKKEADAAILKEIADREASIRANASGNAAALKIQCAWRCYNARFQRRWRHQQKAERQAAEAIQQREEAAAAARAKEISEKNLDLVPPTVAKQAIEAQPLTSNSADLD